jgi:AmpD protein
VEVSITHWLDDARRVPSPNHDDRPSGCEVELLVIHGISLPPGEFGGDLVEQLFLNCLDCKRDSRLADLDGVRVSAHVFIDRGGVVTQFVPFQRRAWHAGASCHRGRNACNDFAVGVELEGADTVPYDDRQYAALTAVTAALMRRYPRLTLGSVVGHSDIAPLRKTDPGPAFDWPRLLSSVLSRLRA